MRPSKSQWALITLVVVAALVLATVAWVGSPGATADPRAIDADTIQGHGAAASNATPGQRANSVLWALANGRLHPKAMPMAALDNRYLGSKGDTFHFIPGAELQFHFDAEPEAWVLINHTGMAIVRKNTAPGVVTVVIPINLPGMQSGDYVRLVDYRLYYRVTNAASYIDNAWLIKMDASTGGHITLDSDGTNRTSTAWASYVRTCAVADCQLSWPSGGFVAITLDLKFTGILGAHDITIGGVLLRVSYD